MLKTILPHPKYLSHLYPFSLAYVYLCGKPRRYSVLTAKNESKLYISLAYTYLCIGKVT